MLNRGPIPTKLDCNLGIIETTDHMTKVNREMPRQSYTGQTAFHMPDLVETDMRCRTNAAIHNRRYLCAG